MSLESEYKEILKPSRKPGFTSIDIWEHLPTLRKYASQCEHITEFGVRDVISTLAFLVSGANKIISYDIKERPRVKHVNGLCNKENVNWAFKMESSIKCEIEETDLLFIDSYHTYTQLKKELLLHNNKVKKYIILHDTELFKKKGEDKKDKGLQPAINEFLKQSPQWKIEKVVTNCNGLTVLKRL